jgi:hypothetical protein
LNPNAPVTLSTAYKTEGILPRWPPRSRTERYRLIRAAPSTGWVVASGRWKCRSSRRLSPHGFSRPVAAPAAHLPTRNEEVSSPTARAANRFRGGARHPAGSRSTVNCSPARCEQAGDGRGRSIRNPPHEGPPGFRPGPAAWLVHPPRKAADSNGTVLPAHPLATEPGALPVHLPCAGRESNPHVRRHTLLRRARLPVTPPARDARTIAGQSDRRDSNSSCELGKFACLPLTLRSHGVDEPARGIEPRLLPYRGSVLSVVTKQA